MLKAAIDCCSIVKEATSLLDNTCTVMILQSSVDHCGHVVAGQSIMQGLIKWVYTWRVKPSAKKCDQGCPETWTSIFGRSVTKGRVCQSSNDEFLPVNVLNNGLHSLNQR